MNVTHVKLFFLGGWIVFGGGAIGCSWALLLQRSVDSLRCGHLKAKGSQDVGSNVSTAVDLKRQTVLEAGGQVSADDR